MAKLFEIGSGMISQRDCCGNKVHCRNGDKWSSGTKSLSFNILLFWLASITQFKWTWIPELCILNKVQGFISKRQKSVSTLQTNVLLPTFSAQLIVHINPIGHSSIYLFPIPPCNTVSPAVSPLRPWNPSFSRFAALTGQFGSSMASKPDIGWLGPEFKTNLI